MKLRVTLVLPSAATSDLTIECDVTTTVADTARALIRAGVLGDPHIAKIARLRLAPVTLRASPSRGTRAFLLDPAVPIGASGLQSGWHIEPVLEFGGEAQPQRLIPAAGYIEVLTGVHAGTRYSIISGTNLIGRDPLSRIYLGDPSVSRRHAALEIGAETTFHDLGSVNGTLLNGAALRGSARRITETSDVTLGEVTIRIFPGPAVQSPVLPPVQSAVQSAVPVAHCVMHTRSPRIARRFPSSTRDLPAPPGRAQQGRLPLLAMLAPALLGGVMYAVTASPMALMMAAFSPLMMIGSWLDTKMGSARKFKREFEHFQQTLAIERDELLELQAREVAVRGAETPTLGEVARSIHERNSLLWTRRPEHRAFLEVRFGTGVLPSRTELQLPPRGEAAPGEWNALRDLETEFGDVAPVPVLERFDRCGSIGVAGPRPLMENMVRSLIVQLVGLHSPSELVLACFTHPDNESRWDWLKWLPHVGSAASPLSTWSLASHDQNSLQLLVELEQLLEGRKRTAKSPDTVRSHQTADTRNDDAQGEAVQHRPTTPAVIVVVLGEAIASMPRLVALAEHGPDVGIHLVWATSQQALLPAACRTFVELNNQESRVNFVRSGAQVVLQHIEHLSEEDALLLARALAPIEDASALVLDESDLPKRVNLREIHAADLLGGPAAIVHSWGRSGTLISQWRRGEEREPLSLAVVVGQGLNSGASLDLRADGPHALVGGTTGSGKSEFLQTWIMSMAATFSPDRLNFLLVDYKGGAAFAECTDLPHTVGLVTDLSPRLVHRALTSLRAELRYREELLAERGMKDLMSMERRSDSAAPAILVIVIDEFAALAADVPEFVDGIVDIAQRGRSLGLHLIMATQRPSGVIRDNLRANTNLRIALRMADESDSSDVINVKDAAYFDNSTPGRGAIKIGSDRITHFQTGYLGGRASDASKRSPLKLRSFGFSEGEQWDIPEGGPGSRAARRRGITMPRDIERVRDCIVSAAIAEGLEQPRRPWQDELPHVVDVYDLMRSAQGSAGLNPASESSRTRPSEKYVIGVQDRPGEQSRTLVRLDFDEIGNLLCLGAGGTGKTMLLTTVAAVLSTDADESPVHIYGIDAAGGALGAIAELPTVGSVASLGDTELTGRILRYLLDAILERGPRYAAAHAGTLTEYRRVSGETKEPRLVLLLDGFGALRQASEMESGPLSPMALLADIMTTGRALGVHVVLTADRPAVIPASLAASLQQQFVLRLASTHDYSFLGVPSEVFAEAPPGRAVLAGDANEIQFASLDGSRDTASQARALQTLAARLQALGIQDAPEVRNAPERISLRDLPPVPPGSPGASGQYGGQGAPGAKNFPVFGIDTRSLVPVAMPTSGLAVIAGPAGSGQSTTALTMVEALEKWAAEQGQSIETTLLTFHSDGLRRARTWGRVACGEVEVKELVEELIKGFGGKLSGTQGVVVVERPAEAEGTEALSAMVALAKAARRAPMLVIFEFELGVTGAWELLSALKQPRWGVALQPDDADSGSPFRAALGRVRRADFPPGRGFVIESGRATPIQIALPGVGK